MPKKYRNNRGFTFIELLVVATIIIILSAIGVVSFTEAGKNARDGKRKADMETVRQALVLYRSDNGEYPKTANYNVITNALTSGGYLSPPAPSDPKAGHTLYSYSVDSNGTTFCLCADMENDARSGNSSGGSNGICTFVSGENLYCVQSP